MIFGDRTGLNKLRNIFRVKKPQQSYAFLSYYFCWRVSQAECGGMCRIQIPTCIQSPQNREKHSSSVTTYRASPIRTLTKSLQAKSCF